MGLRSLFHIRDSADAASEHLYVRDPHMRRIPSLGALAIIAVGITVGLLALRGIDAAPVLLGSR